METIDCPYCEEMWKLDPTDFDFGEDHPNELECPKCDKSFVVFVEVAYVYSSYRADCLNGEPHNMGEWRTSHWERSVRREYRSCADCSHRETRVAEEFVEEGSEENIA